MITEPINEIRALREAISELSEAMRFPEPVVVGLSAIVDKTPDKLDELIAEVRALRADVASMRESASSTCDILNRVTCGGSAVLTTAT